MTGKHVVIMALGILLFGLGVPIGIVTSLPSGNYLKLTADGLEYRSMFGKAQRLAWSTIEAFSPVSNAVTGKAQFVGWNFRPGFGAERRASRFAKALAGVHGQFPNTYGMNPADLSTMLNERLRTALAGEQETPN